MKHIKRLTLTALLLTQVACSTVPYSNGRKGWQVDEMLLNIAIYGAAIVMTREIGDSVVEALE